MGVVANLWSSTASTDWSCLRYVIPLFVVEDPVPLPTFQVLAARILLSIIHVHGGDSWEQVDGVRSGVAIVSGWVRVHLLGNYASTA